MSRGDPRDAGAPRGASAAHAAGEPGAHGGSAVLRAVVVVPARDEEERIGACLRALSGQAGLVAVVLVLDGCADGTERVARATAAATGLPLELVEGPARGVGFARGLGMAVAAKRLREEPAGVLRVIASTDADSVVAPDWLARTRAALASDGAAAVGGRIVLDPLEAALVPREVLAAREAEAARRLIAVRRHAPAAGHHQFSGASLALTLAAYDAVGGLPATPTLEDEALERALRAAGVPITYAADVRVTTSARTAGHAPRGLAQALRTASWRAAQDVEASGERPRDGASTIRCVRGGARGDALVAAREEEADVVLALGPGVTERDAAPLLAALAADPELQLVRAADPEPDLLAELVARPALNLHAPELALLTSPLTRTWAIRTPELRALALPHGDAADLTVLVDVALRHGLSAIGERPLAGPVRTAAATPHNAPPAAPPTPPDHAPPAAPPIPAHRAPSVPGQPERADAPLDAYELLVALTARFAAPPTGGAAFSDHTGSRRALLDEHPPHAGQRVPATT